MFNTCVPRRDQGTALVPAVTFHFVGDRISLLPITACARLAGCSFWAFSCLCLPSCLRNLIFRYVLSRGFWELKLIFPQILPSEPSLHPQDIILKLYLFTQLMGICVCLSVCGSQRTMCESSLFPFII